MLSQAGHYPHVDPQYVAEWFYEQGWHDSETAILVSAHVGRQVARRTIAGIRRGELGYSGRNLAPAFAALAYVWQIT